MGNEGVTPFSPASFVLFGIIPSGMTNSEEQFIRPLNNNDKNNKEVIVSFFKVNIWLVG